MCQIKGMAHFVDCCPEHHTPTPCRRIGVTRRGILNKAVGKDRRPLSVVWPDIIKHDTAEAAPAIMPTGKEHPHGPFGSVLEPRPIGHHGIVHFRIAPRAIGPCPACGDHRSVRRHGNIKTRTTIDRIHRDVFRRQVRRAVRVRANIIGGCWRIRVRYAINLELNLVKVLAFKIKAIDTACSAGANQR